MKVALCFSGQLRFVNEYSKFIIENIINHYHVDIYAHLWYNENMLGKPFHHEFNDLYKEKIDDFIKIYSPKKIKIENEYKMDDKIYNYKSNEQDLRISGEDCKKCIFRMNSQFYSIQECYKLIENPDDYDFIIRIRTDCYITSPLKLDTLTKNILYIQNGYCAGSDRKFCDWFAVGHNTVMKEYCNIYNDFHKFYKDGVIHMHKFMELSTSHINRIDYEFNVPLSHAFPCYKYNK